MNTVVPARHGPVAAPGAASTASASAPSATTVPHLAYLDGWRGIAIICVLFGHFGEVHGLGTLGVSIFFVLSGVLMSRILFVQQTPLRTFYRRRAARILPVFWIYLCVVFGGSGLFLGRFDAIEFLSTATFLRSYTPVESILRSEFPVAHIWSLSVEEHGYVLLSLLSLLAIRFGERSARWALAACALACLAFFLYYKFNPPLSATPFHFRSEVAALPLVLSCLVFLQLRRWPIVVPPLVPLLLLAAAFAVALLSTSVFLSLFAVSGLLALSINTLHVAPAWALNALSHPVLRWFGVCSFSIYLWQQVFYHGTRYAQGIPYYPVLAAAASLAVAALSYHGLENPLRKRLSGRR